MNGFPVLIRLAGFKGDLFVADTAKHNNACHLASVESSDCTRDRRLGTWHGGRMCKRLSQNITDRINPPKTKMRLHIGDRQAVHSPEYLVQARQHEIARQTSRFRTRRKARKKQTMSVRATAASMNENPITAFWEPISTLPLYLLVFSKKMVRPERFELPTFWFVARRSIQLS
jgi:hypothetical protein